MFDHKYKFARLIWGVRMENFVQTLYARKNTNPADDIKLDTVKRDYLPSANLILSLSKKQNIRFAYSQTVNRPEYRELAPFAFYDFSTQLVVSGRDSLSRAKIHNLDFRYEYYPGRGQLLSTSVFYKKFIDPIETISLSYTDNEITYRNLKEAQNYGLEIEYRVLLAALLKADSIAFLNNLTVFSNLAIIRSKVNTADVVGSGAADRPLQGQSPYVFNAGLLYINDKLNCSFAASFNRVGSRIYIVGNINEPAIWEAPRSFMDFQFSKLLWKKRIELKLNVQNS
jgi:outer membrane receptor protein involved in Fe transport